MAHKRKHSILDQGVDQIVYLDHLRGQYAVAAPENTKWSFTADLLLKTVLALYYIITTLGSGIAHARKTGDLQLIEKRYDQLKALYDELCWHLYRGRQLNFPDEGDDAAKAAEAELTAQLCSELLDDGLLDDDGEAPSEENEELVSAFASANIQDGASGKWVAMSVRGVQDVFDFRDVDQSPLHDLEVAMISQRHPKPVYFDFRDALVVCSAANSNSMSAHYNLMEMTGAAAQPQWNSWEDLIPQLRGYTVSMLDRNGLINDKFEDIVQGVMQHVVGCKLPTYQVEQTNLMTYCLARIKREVAQRSGRHPWDVVDPVTFGSAIGTSHWWCDTREHGVRSDSACDSISPNAGRFGVHECHIRYRNNSASPISESAHDQMEITCEHDGVHVKFRSREPLRRNASFIDAFSNLDPCFQVNHIEGGEECSSNLSGNMIGGSPIDPYASESVSISGSDGRQYLALLVGTNSGVYLGSMTSDILKASVASHPNQRDHIHIAKNSVMGTDASYYSPHDIVIGAGKATGENITGVFQAYVINDISLKI